MPLRHEVPYLASSSPSHSHLQKGTFTTGSLILVSDTQRVLIFRFLF